MDNCRENWKRWIGRIVYSFLFCVFIVLFLAILLWFFMSLLHPFRPHLLHQSPRGSPGLSFRPTPDNHLSTLIHFRHGAAGDWGPYVQNLRRFLKSYSKGKRPGSSIKCQWNTTIDENMRCHVSNRKTIDFTTDHACTKVENYGYSRGRPCVLLKINRRYGWQPEPYYNISEIMSLGKMPQSLKSEIFNVWTQNCQGKSYEAHCPNMRMVWMSCEGDTAVDKENLGLPVFTPWMGFPGFYFPFLGQMHYLSPYVFVQFRDLTPGVLINVVCKLWAKNILNDERNPRVGGVKFELLMD